METLRADEVLVAVARRHTKDLFLTEVKTGPTLTAPQGQLHRIDALAVARSWTHPLVTGYECKISRQDWVRDDKWHSVLGDCHSFYIACPWGVVVPEEVPPDVGLIWVRSTGSLSVRRKAVYRDIALPALLLYYVALARIDSDRHPFFSSRRDALRAGVSDKASRRDLAEAVGGAIRRSLLDADTQVHKAQAATTQAQEDAARWQQARVILEAYGIRTDRWAYDWAQQLRMALSGAAGQKLRSAVADLVRAAQGLQRMVEGSEAQDAPGAR